ncbi:MAG: histidine kinase dimerization/phospho-acceptor domain-containing protein, partial [Anaerolineales bacterium]
MSNSLLLTLLIILILLLAWMTWQYVALRRRMENYARTVRRAANGDLPPHNLPADLPTLGGIPSAVIALSEAYETRLAVQETARARLDTVLSQMTDGVLIADAEGRVRYANPAALKLFNGGKPLTGYTVTEAIRHHKLVEAWRACQQTRDVQTDSVELPARRQFLQLVAIPDTYEGGSILLVQDLTRVRRLETVRRDFISNVSHELRTPLASLKALTETLQSGALEDPPAARRFLQRIETEVDALTQMATELLELSRIESGQMPLSRHPVEPSRLLRIAADRMHAQAERAGLHLSCECPPEIPHVNADATRIEQVLVNLIHNAIKFTAPGGRILVSAAPSGEFVQFSVS